MKQSRIVRWHDLRRWQPSLANAVVSEYSPVPLGDVLTRRTEAVAAADFANFTPITIKFTGTIKARNRTEAFQGAMFAGQPGDLLFSKIDVRNGAIALLPAKLGPAVVTSEYPIYVPDTDQVDAGYLALLLRTAPFKALLRDAASGTSGRKRVAPEDFEELEVPLPSPAEQQRLSAAHRLARKEAAALDEEATRVEQAAVLAFEAALGLTPPPDLPRRRAFIARWADFDRWSAERVMQVESARNHTAMLPTFDLVPLEEVAEVAYGLQVSPSSRPHLNARPYLRVANVKRGGLDLTHIKYIDVPNADLPKYELQVNDILMCEGSSADQVGRGAMWRGEIPGCVHQNHVLRIRVREDVALLPEFLLACINSPTGRAYFRLQAKQTTNLASINSLEVNEMPVPLPVTIEEQQTILTFLTDAEKQFVQLRQQAATVRAEADAAFATAIFG